MWICSSSIGQDLESPGSPASGMSVILIKLIKMRIPIPHGWDHSESGDLYKMGQSELDASICSFLLTVDINTQ